MALPWILWALGGAILGAAVVGAVAYFLTLEGEDVQSYSDWLRSRGFPRINQALIWFVKKRKHIYRFLGIRIGDKSAGIQVVRETRIKMKDLPQSVRDDLDEDMSADVTEELTYALS